MKRTNQTLGLFTWVALVATGCTGFKGASEAADRAVPEIHALYNDGKFAEIRNDAHSKFQDSMSEKDLTELMEAMQRKLGKVKSTTKTGFHLQSVNTRTTVKLQQRTTFEHGSGDETFDFEMSGDKAMLVGYDIKSKELVVK